MNTFCAAAFFFYIAFCSEETGDPVRVTDLFPNIPVAHEAEVFLEIYLCSLPCIIITCFLYCYCTTWREVVSLARIQSLNSSVWYFSALTMATFYRQGLLNSPIYQHVTANTEDNRHRITRRLADQGSVISTQLQITSAYLPM